MKQLLTFILFLICSSGVYADESSDAWIQADINIVRLEPTKFPMLPSAIKHELESRSCLIPQSYEAEQPENVISGQFGKNKDLDWAVLCSKDRESSILIFWDGSVKDVESIEKHSDKEFIELIGGKPVYARVISTIDKAGISAYAERSAEDAHTLFSHDGIKDVYSWRASIVHYFDKGKWKSKSSDVWIQADINTVRLEPKKFPVLPSAIRHELESRSCLIPQSYEAQQPENVISGQFGKNKGLDWAVLCSQNRESSILIFWDGSVKDVDSIEKSSDNAFLQGTGLDLQGIGRDNIGYSRVIATIHKSGISAYAERYSFSAESPEEQALAHTQFSHDGIEDIF